jgi:hypothetical protein
MFVRAISMVESLGGRILKSTSFAGAWGHAPYTGMPRRL